MALDNRTPADLAGIQVEGEDKVAYNHSKRGVRF
jgi:hypothetical protein